MTAADEGEASAGAQRLWLEWPLALLLGVVWLLAVTLHLDLSLRGAHAWVPLYVAPASEARASPQVTGFWPETTPHADGLLPGDHLLAVDGASLRGADRLATLAAIYSAAAAAPPTAEDGTVRFEITRDGALQTASLTLRRLNAPWSLTPLILGMGIGALAVWSRRRESPAARACALAMLAYSTHWAMFVSAGGWRTELGLVLHVVAGALFGPLALRAVLLVASESAPLPRGALAWPWLFLGMAALWTSWLLGTPLPGRLGVSLLLGSYVVLIAAILATLTWSYRRGGAVVRRQLRWVLLALYLGLAPPAAVATLAAWDPLYRPLYEWSLLSTLFIPIGIAIALTRFQLFDIDRLISATAAYSIVVIAFLVVLVTPVLASAAAFGERAGLDSRLVYAGAVLLLATAGVLAAPRIQPRLERIFFRERHAFQGGIRDLRVALGTASEPADLFETLGVRLADLLRARSCAIYVLAGDAFTPAWARGPSIPPGFAYNGRLAGFLDEAAAPVDEARWRRWTQRNLLDPVEAGALETLDPSLLVPILGEKGLVAFLALGEKASEDIYTSVDLALLDGLADRVSAEIYRFDTTAVERHQRERLERLARYVPAPVRDEVLARPIEAKPGERDVSVLFVDVRGYTGFSEGRSPDEIFRVVNAYTTAASRIIREHEGWVVEFQGDGLMAVFGAPRKLEHKEDAAIAAGLALIDTFAKRAVPELAEYSLEVGVGVATGPAYVGNVQSIDRQIWCVIGNTTNLAARLQGLTKDFDADLVIDDSTRQRASDARRFVQRDGVRVRGRSQERAVHLASARREASAVASA